MIARPTPLVRLRALAPSVPLWAKLESLHASGSVYDRVADRVVARASGRSLAVAGGGPWCLAVLGAAARAGAEVVSVFLGADATHETRVLLRDFGRPVVAGVSADVAEQQAVERGATLAQAVAADFADSLGAELLRDLVAIDGGSAATVFAPADAHALVDGLRLVGLHVEPVFADARARTLEGLARATDGTPLTIGDAAAADVRRRAAQTEGLLMSHASAAVVAAALGAPHAGVRVALITGAGDRVFSLDVGDAA